MRTRAATFVVLGSLLWALPGIAPAQVLTGTGQRTFTTDADFAQGTFDGARAGAPDADQLRIDTGAKVAPYLWIANATAGAVTKIDTRTGRQVARYDSVLTHNWDGSIPSVRPPRDACNSPAPTAVDIKGNAFVVNRGNCAGTSAAITRYAGSLAACVDRNGNGQIDTSSDVNGDGAISLSDPTEFRGQADECILWTKNYAAAGDPGRSLVVDADGNLWAAGFSSSKLYRLDGLTGQVLKVIDLKVETGVASGIQSLAMGPGGLLYTSDNSTLRLIRKIDPNAPEGSRVVGTLVSPVPTFGIVVDRNGLVWMGSDADSAVGPVMADFTAQTIVQVNGGSGCTGRTHGITVDATGDIWAACWGNNRMLRLGSNGASKGIWFVGARPEGVAVAADGRIWLTLSGGDAVAVFNPTTGAVQTFPAGGGPFTYGDMTGYQHHRFVARQGTWRAVHDSGTAGTNWGTLTWNQEAQGATPAGTSITVAVRAANTREALPALPFAQVANGQAFAGIQGRFLEVQATLRSVYFSGEPVLSDLTIATGNHPPVARCVDQNVCAGPACTAQVSVNDGSYDPDGDPISLAQSPAGPYAIGTRAVSLAVSDGFASDSCSGSVQVRDCEPPSITCPAPATAECVGGSASNSAVGTASASDVCSPVAVQAPGVASFPLGTVTLTWSAADTSGNTASCSTPFTVADTQAPAVTIPGPSARTLECGSTYADPLVTASDTCVGDVSGQLVASGAVDAGKPGSYSRTWRVTDPSGNSAPPATLTVTVVDTQAPTLALQGEAHPTLECGSAYVEPGAQVSDVCASNLGGAVEISGTVDTGQPGDYTRTYSVMDPSGNVALPVTRTVTVKDTLAPELYLNGPSSLALECKVNTYVEEGAAATDLCSGNLTDAITITGTVNTDAPGTYPRRYRVQDARGLVTEKVRDVRVVDTRAPTLTVSGSSAPVMECSREGFVAMGATAMDLCAGDISNRITISGTENIVAPGTYPITYSVKDPSGNAAESVTRSVTVRDTQAPAVTIVGEASQVLECGVDTYLELGATAYDACQGDMTSQLNTYGNGANTAAVGTYSIQYGVWDSSGNTTMALRTVKVVDRLPPTLSLVGSATVQHECASGLYEDPGATASDACYGDLTLSVTRTGSVNAWARGSYPLTYSVQDSTLLKAPPVTRTVQVVDTQPPTLEYREVTVSPADQAMRGFSLADCVTATDTCDGYALANNGSILSIYSDEPEDAPGDGDGSTAEDIVITGRSTFKVRAERKVAGDGRVYGVAFELKDQTGNTRSGLCRIRVPAADGVVASDSGAGAGYTVVAPPRSTLARRTAP